MRDGVTYEIRVVKEGGGLWGRWTCTDCSDDGESSKKCLSVEDAVAVAKSNLRLHHIRNHQ
jgi:hypothetical protein